ncbi:MAG: hypothetical protein IAE97_01860 [Chthoniobacterales bacterium]|nr:hypothetical protein [Chthoniobacterales bacterium]
MRIWIKAALILTAVWLVAGAVIIYSNATRPSADSLVRYTEGAQLDNLDPAQRAVVIAGVADRLNRLDFEEREELRRRQWDRSFFGKLTPEERHTFIEATLPEGFRQLMIGLNKMDPEQRRRIVKRALDDLDEDQPDIPRRFSEADAKRVVEEGLGAFYEDASAEVKLDFAPVIERLQKSLQSLR